MDYSAAFPILLALARLLLSNGPSVPYNESDHHIEEDPLMTPAPLSPLLNHTHLLRETYGNDPNTFGYFYTISSYQYGWCMQIGSSFGRSRDFLKSYSCLYGSDETFKTERAPGNIRGFRMRNVDYDADVLPSIPRGPDKCITVGNGRCDKALPNGTPATLQPCDLQARAQLFRVDRRWNRSWGYGYYYMLKELCSGKCLEANEVTDYTLKYTLETCARPSSNGKQLFNFKSSTQPGCLARKTC